MRVVFSNADDIHGQKLKTDRMMSCDVHVFIRSLSHPFHSVKTPWSPCSTFMSACPLQLNRLLGHLAL